MYLEFKHEIEKEFRELKSYIAQHYGHDPMKIREILKVYNIYQTNHFENGVSIKASRINHSCCPNSIDCHGSIKEVRAMKHIKKGEEITLSYIINSYDSKAVREIELNYWHFKCSCNACKLTGERLLMNEQIRG